jgi:hypothetical protein
VFIDPGSPWQNAWIESFNGRLRDELLNLWQFDSLLEAQVIIEDWRIDYNTNRPHSAHGDLTPTEFAQAWTTKQVTNPKPHSCWTTRLLGGSSRCIMTLLRGVRLRFPIGQRYLDLEFGGTLDHFTGRIYASAERTCSTGT